MRPLPRRVLATLTATVSVLAPLALTPALSPQASAAPSPLRWHRVDPPTDQQFRGLDALDGRHAWIAGSGGEVWKTADAGGHWREVGPPGAGKLEFRDVEATDYRHVQVLAIGTGTASRIYRTVDGGAHWTTTFVNHAPKAFYDCMAMYPGGRNGLAMSDPVHGRLRVITTHDSGASWQVADPAGMPTAVDGEFGFAASGTCVVTAGTHDAYLASGGGASRVFHSRDRGLTWTVSDSTIPAAEAGGVFSLAFRSRTSGLAVGGDYTKPRVGTDASARTRTAGRTWANAGDLGGYRSGVAWKRDAGRVAVAVGTSGSDLSHDGGLTWRALPGGGFDAVSCVSGACWASGADGHVARLRR